MDASVDVSFDSGCLTACTWIQGTFFSLEYRQLAGAYFFYTE